MADTRNNQVQVFAPGSPAPVIAPIPGGTGVPTDRNGNGRNDFADVDDFFNNL